MPHNTLQIFINDIYFDRPSLSIMWGYIATFARAGVDGDFQMYLSPASFRIVRIDRPGRADLVHRYDGDGLLVGSFPTEGLESVSLTTFFVRDVAKHRDAGALLADLFRDHGAGDELADALEPLVQRLPRVGAVASMVLRLPRALGVLIGQLLKSRKDAIKIYGEGSMRVQGLAEDFAARWGVNEGDKGFFNTSWDFCTTKDPYAMVTSLELPRTLQERLGLLE